MTYVGKFGVMERRLTRYWLLAAVFFLFVGPVLNLSGSIYLNSTHLYFSIFFVFSFLFKISKRTKIDKELGCLLFSCLLVSSYFLFATMQAGDLRGIVDVIFVLIAIVASFELSRNFYRSGAQDPLELFFRFCFYCAILWGGAIITSYLSPPFRTGMDQLFFRDYSRGDHLVLLRVPAFHPTGGDGASMNFALLILLSSGYVYFLRGLKKMLAIFILVFSLVFSLLSARSGFILCAPLLLISFVLSMRSSVLVKFSALLAGIFMVVALFVSLAPFLDIYKSDSLRVYGHEHPISRTLKTLDGFSRGGVSSTTAGTLFDMLIIPNNNFHLFFGSGDFGRYIQSAYDAKGSDVGYIRILNGVGLLGSLLIYTVFILPILLLSVLVSRLSKARSKPFRSFFLPLFSLVTLFLFLGNIKITYLLSGYANLMLFSLFFILMFECKKALSCSLVR
jgi:hypothetical protein